MGQVALRNSDATSRALKVFAVRGATALLCDGDMVDALKIIPGSGFFTEVEARASQMNRNNDSCPRKAFHRSELGASDRGTRIRDENAEALAQDSTLPPWAIGGLSRHPQTECSESQLWQAEEPVPESRQGHARTARKGNKAGAVIRGTKTSRRTDAWRRHVLARRMT
ncbi:hypothetical protein PCL_01454 [Purpureocillium lilacinum]|uniref:Uncharacterized protein n=1 Tax=Purpureocillium lilacinum TaxID=33203 RepID=A0A2U3E3K6_PURLI|nr:hypothetical protein PCL_01454 [Purpureocillium lilacinum]